MFKLPCNFSQKKVPCKSIFLNNFVLKNNDDVESFGKFLL